MSDRSPDLQKPVVLLAVDGRLIAESLSQGLRNAGFQIRKAADGEDALRQCLESRPDVALLDCDMAQVSGLDVARALHPAPFPLIFLAGHADEQLVRAAADLGVMAFLLKPIDPVHLIPAIHTALRRFSELTALRGESAQLSTALKAARATSVVVGLLMERLRLTEKDAYDRLRAHCRSNNRKIAEVAAEILVTTERLHETLSAIGGYGMQSKPPAV